MRRRVPVAVAAVVLLLAGGYLTADARDLVPGPLTTRPAVPPPAAYPSVAVAVPDPGPVLPSLAGVAAGDVQALVDGVVGDLGPQATVHVRDLASGATVGAHRADLPVAPASALKILTAVAAVSELGPEARLPTTATLAGDRVTLVGGGDTLLTTGKPEPDAAGASLTDLAGQVARALRAAGTKTVQVAVDDTLFTGPRYVADWGSLDRLYVLPTTPLALERGHPEGAGVDPRPALTAGEAFAAELREAGVSVTGDVVSAPSPAGATEAGRIESAPVSQVVRFALKLSDNSTSETLGRLVALARGEEGSGVGATRAVRAALADLDLPVAGLTLDDVCGLSTRNRVPAELLTAAVAAAESHPAIAGLPASLPVGHLDGTLEDRLADAPGVVRAKTGTLTSVASLAGLVQADSGAALAFAVIAPDTDIATARQRMDAFAAELARRG